MVAALWSRSGASAAPAQISAPASSTGQGMGRPAAAVAAPTPSQAAAPDSECAGPIMACARPDSSFAAARLTGDVDAAPATQRSGSDLRADSRFPHRVCGQARGVVTLIDRLPPTADPDALYEAFESVGRRAERGLTLYPHQEEAW
ncbi:hypothetical protein STENM223S_11155 [Streptomyces tendae]